MRHTSFTRVMHGRGWSVALACIFDSRIVARALAAKRRMTKSHHLSPVPTISRGDAKENHRHIRAHAHTHTQRYRLDWKVYVWVCLKWRSSSGYCAPPMMCRDPMRRAASARKVCRARGHKLNGRDDAKAVRVPTANAVALSVWLVIFVYWLMRTSWWHLHCGAGKQLDVSNDYIEAIKTAVWLQLGVRIISALWIYIEEYKKIQRKCIILMFLIYFQITYIKTFRLQKYNQ